MGKRFCCDLETDGLLDTVSTIYIVGFLDLDTGEYYAATDDDDITEALMLLADADLLVTYNGNNYDLKVIELLTHGLLKFDRSKHVDLYEYSKELFPNLPRHRLKDWGELLGYPKIDYTGGFDEFTPEMLPYCERDVRLTAALYEFFCEYLEQLIENKEAA